MRPAPSKPRPWAADIRQLLDALHAVPSQATFTNPYICPDRCHNLGAYLTALRSRGYSGHLLVGEAPGYRGCAVTGIPFTSKVVLDQGGHPFIRALFPTLKLSGRQGEATATTVWALLAACERVAALWNVFPFHPHQPKEPKSNRTPNTEEVATGRPFLEVVIRILRPSKIVAIGNMAAQALKRQFPEVAFARVRRPSKGGRVDFLVAVIAACVVLELGQGSSPRPILARSR
jgi:uracil-DNA glycosylase